MTTNMTTTKLPSRGAAEANQVAGRVRRTVLVGVLASFVGFFGIAVVSTPPSQSAASAAASSDTRVVCTSDLCEVVKVHARTRTS
jgi:hypothetical protein